MRIETEHDAGYSGPARAPDRGEPGAAARAQSKQSRDEAMLWVACTVVLGLLWALIVAVGAGRAELNRSYRSDLAQSTAKGFAEYVGQNMLMADHVLMHARGLYERTGRIPPLADLTEELGPIADMLLQLSAADAQGHVIASSLPMEPDVSIADRPHFIEFRQDPRDRLHVGQPMVGRVSKKMSLQLVRPLLGPRGEFHGIIVASIDPLKLQQYFGALAAFRRGGTVLIAGRADGIVRVRFSSEGITWGQSLSGSAAWPMLTRSPSGQLEVDSTIDNVKRLVGYHEVAGYPLVVAVTSRSTGWPVTEMALSVAIGVGFSIIQVLYTRSRIRRIREQQVLIQQLTQSREREAEASRMKSRFIASVSHELRTPLNAILGFSELVRDMPDHPDNAKRAGLIHTSGQHLHALLNTLLDLAKIEAGRMEVERAQVDLVDTVRTLAEVHRASAGKKGLAMNFETSVPASHTVFAETDSTKLVQVLNNVLNNAVKFTSAGGIRVSASLHGASFMVQVEDSGRGIPAEQIARVFDRFSTASTPGSASEKGTGLGLSLSRELVRLLGGSIGISSRPGRGTQVRIRLPGARLVELQP